MDPLHITFLLLSGALLTVAFAWRYWV